MKKLISTLLLVIPMVVMAAMPGPIQEVSSAIRKGDATAVAKLFDSSVDITIMDDEDTYSRSQGEQVLKSFFSSNKPSNFVVKHDVYYSNTKNREELTMIEAIKPLIDQAFAEDLSSSGDHSAKASIPATAEKKARLIIKDDGIIAGVELAEMIFKYYDSSIQFEKLIDDGAKVKFGDEAFHVSGKVHTLLSVERIVLNFMQRMSGIATLSKVYADAVEGTGTKVLDTRKTTPGLRYIEKWAVRIGGGHNHRMGLYDMIMLKDNHNDYAGGIRAAIESTRKYISENSLSIKVEMETRNLEEVKEVLNVGGVDRIMLDNFTPVQVKEAVQFIDGRVETEASGGITLKTIRDYAEAGVDYISVGALTHSFKSLDMSLKAF